MIILPRLLQFIEKRSSEEQEASDSAGSSEDDMPLSKYPQQKPTVGEKGPDTETHVLAQYVEQRDAKIKNQSMVGKTNGGFQPARKVTGVDSLILIFVWAHRKRILNKNHKKEASKQGGKITVLQSNLNLFAQLYVALQSRDGDMREFSSHELQSFPPALSEFKTYAFQVLSLIS